LPGLTSYLRNEPDGGEQRLLSVRDAQAREARVVFVNIARGEQSPTNDLVRLLDEGRLAAALDVYRMRSIWRPLRSGKFILR